MYSGEASQTHKVALANHDKLMDRHSNFISEVGNAKLDSLKEGGKLLVDDSPLYHDKKVYITSADHLSNPNTVPGTAVYINADYHNSVQGLEKYQHRHKTNLAESEKHVLNLRTHPDVKSIEGTLQEARKMRNAMKAAGPWVYEHFQDPNAEKEIQTLKESGRQRAMTPRPKDHLIQKAADVRQVMADTPRLRQGK